MSRCAKFHHAMDENWNFCGMSKTSMSYYKHYRETVRKMVSQGLEEDFVYEHFTEGPDRLIGNIKDDETRTKALDYVSACLHRGEQVTEGDLRASLKAWSGNGNGSGCRTRSEKLTNVNNKPQSAPEIPKEAQNVKPQIDQDAARKEEMAEAAKNQPPIPPITDNSPIISPNSDSLPAWTIDLCKSGKCPDGQDHTNRNDKREVIGCAGSGFHLKQITHCPIIDRMRKAAEGPGTGFARASGAPDIDPHTGGRIIKPAGIRVVKTPLTADELTRCADDLIERSGIFTAKEVGLVDDLVRAQYEGIRSRADFIKKACNWFLTSAEGE